MSDKIVIRVKPYEGEYDFDLEDEPLTTLEWRWVKKISGYLPLTLEQGWEGADPDLFLALAVVALVRAGKVDKQHAITTADRLADAPFDGVSISFVGTQEDDAEDPPGKPAATPATEQQKPSSGGSGSPRLEVLGNGQSSTGALGSPTSSISAQTI